jgi:hypothetical protein
MKTIIVVLALALTSCTTYHDTGGGGTVDYFTMARNLGVTFYYPNGQPRAHWDSNDNVAVWDAAGRFVGNIGSAAAEVLIAHGAAQAVAHGAQNGVQLLTAAVPPTVQKVTSRNANHGTPTPIPAAIRKP